MKLRRLGLAVVVLAALLGPASEAAAAYGDITDHAIPGIAFDVTLAEGGALWFARGESVGRLSSSGAVTTFPIPDGGYASKITPGGDGNVWFVGGRGKFRTGIGRVTPSGAVTIFPVTLSPLEVIDVTLGPDGNVWFTAAFHSFSRVGRITPSGAVTIFDGGTGGTGDTRPIGAITAGRDGNLWYQVMLGGGASESSRIVRMTTSGARTVFPTVVDWLVPGMTSGPDGNIWFTESSRMRIGRVTPSGSFSFFPLPTSDFGPDGITSGPDGNLWFTEFNGNEIGRVTMSGAVTEFSAPGAGLGITSGGGDVWFTVSRHALARFDLSPKVDAGPDVAGVEASPVSLSGVATGGSTVTSAWTASSGACVFADPSAAATTVVCADDGIYTLNLIATDSRGRTASDTLVLTVANGAPSIVGAAVSGAGMACLDEPSAFALTFGVTDTADEAHDPITGFVDWGDGDVSTFAGRTVDVSHGYAAGSHTLTVEVADGDGGTDSWQATVETLYTPGEFMAPVRPDGRSKFKTGSTIPVKLRVLDCKGRPVDGQTLTVQLEELGGRDVVVRGASNGGAGGGAAGGDQMRYDAEDEQYIHNLSTSASTYADGSALAPGRYRLTVGGSAVSPRSTEIELVG